MTAPEIIEVLNTRFPGRILASYPGDKHPRVHIEAANWREMAQFLRSDPQMQFDWLANLSGVDYVAEGKLAVVYDLYSYELKHTFAVKAFCPRDNAHAPSVHDIWSAANWHEREAYDMFGLIFDGHPNLTRILCDDNWVGFPLRKDYVFPTEYQGIPASLGLEWDPSTKPQAK
jgi:NADH-quinone oxidoreductase subunit C